MDRTSSKELSAPWHPYVTFGLLAAIGIAAVLFSTTWGVGLTPDSLTYIDTARNLLAGNGLSVETTAGKFEPMVLYPPMFPALVAAAGLFGDPLGGARYLNALLFGANTFIAGWLIYLCTKGKSWAAILGSVIILTSDSMLSVHVRAISEPLFILCMLSALFALSIYLDHGKRVYLLLSASAIGLSILTRYVGVVVILTAFTGMWLFSSGSFRRKFTDSVMLVVVSGLPVSLWILRNAYLTGQTTGRQWVCHPITWEQIRVGLNTVSDWLLPAQVFPEQVRFAALGICVLAFCVLNLLSYVERTRHNDCNHADDETSTGRNLFTIFLINYVGFLLVYISLGCVDTPLDIRILSPAFVALIVLIASSMPNLLASLSNRKLLKTILVVCFVLFTASYIGRGATRVAFNHINGVGYASKAWKQSALVQYVKDLPPGIPVYSNGNDVLYLLTGKRTYGLPIEVNSVTGEPNANFVQQIAAMGERLKAEQGVVVYFDRINWRWYLPTKEELIQLLPLEVTMEATDGCIYTIRN